MIVSAFLPFVDSSEFLQVAENTLIQQGSGWVFLVLGLVVLALAFRAHGGASAGWPAIVIGLIGVGLAIYLGVDEDLRTLTSAADTSELGLDDALDVLSREEVADPGIGVYVAGIGSAVVAVAGLRLRTHSRS